MANLVKWWKQFRQYKVIHECSTDSEDLIHASEYGDFFMQQKENILQHNLDSLNAHDVKMTHARGNLMKNKRPLKENDEKERIRNDHQERLQKRHSIATTHNLEQLETNRSKYNKISCDVSLEDSFEKSQPMNFTFTLYDLDGHGIITKEDIASIVSTIYDSIGKNMVAPLYGKKVINVKLTMSPQDIIKSNDHNQKIRKQVSTQRYLRTNVFPNEPESENNVPVMKLQNDINAQDISRNCENFEKEKNNIYESINNLKGYKPTIDKILSKNIKTENVDTKNCLDANLSEKSHLERIEESRNHTKNNSNSNKRRNQNRKQRFQKQKFNEKSARIRSLSVGNEYKLRQNQNQKLNKTTELNNGSKLRRNELIEIIRESMEKNKLCFQSNRKTPNTENFSRQRSNTITMMEAHNLHDKINHCGFDSYLHSTLCSKIEDTSKVNQFECIMNKPALTLKTSVLNQLNPTLTPEQKLARKLNDIEKWLLERETATKIKTTPDKNILNQIKCEKLTSEPLYDAKNPLPTKVSSPRNEKPLPRCSKLQKDAINSIKNKNMTAYPNIYIDDIEKLRECENLISASEGDENEEAPSIYANINDNTKLETQPDKSENLSKPSSVRFVHIHHHYYHFEDDAKDKE